MGALNTVLVDHPGHPHTRSARCGGGVSTHLDRRELELLGASGCDDDMLTVAVAVSSCGMGLRKPS